MSQNIIQMEAVLNDKVTPDIEKMAKACGLSVEKFKKMMKEVYEVQQEMAKYSKEVTRAFKTVQRESERAMKLVAKEAERAARKSEQEFKSMQEKAKQSFGTIEKIARRTFLAIATFSGFAVKGFADYEYSIKKIQTISKDSYEMISTNIRKMAYETGTSSKELASSLYDIVQVIQDSPDKYKMLDTVNKLSIAGFTGTTQAAELLNSIMLTYGMTVADLVKVSNKLIVTQNLGNTTIEKMAHNLGTLIPQAKMANVSLDEVLATVATLTLGGIRTDKATTGLRAMLSELSNESSKLGKEFKKITGGLDFKNYTLSGGTIIGALKLIQEKAKDADKAVSEYFGNIRSKMSAGGLAILEKKYTEVLDAIANAPNDQLARAYETILDTTKTNLERIKMVVSTYSQEIGERVATDLAGVLKIDDVKSFEDLFNEKNIDQVYSLGKAIFFATGGITALGIALKGIETAKAAFALLVNPAGALIAALGGIYYGIRKILDVGNEEFEKNKKWLNETEEGLRKQIETLKEIQKQKEKGGFRSLKALRELEGFSPKVLSDLEMLNNMKVNAYNRGNIKQFEKLAKEFREIMEREIARLENREIHLNAKVFINADVLRENSRQKAFESLLNIEDIDKISKEFHGGKYKGNKNEKYIYEDYLTQLDSLNVSKRSTLRKEISKAISGLAKRGYNASGDKKGATKDPFKELISELGVKIKQDFKLQEKIDILENAKSKFKNHLSEINIAIRNLKTDLLKEKISGILKGIGLEEHSYSIDEKNSKLSNAREELTKYLQEILKNPKENADEIKKTQEEIDKVDFTKFKMNFEDFIEKIKIEIESLKDRAEKGLLPKEEAIAQAEKAREDILARLNEAKDVSSITEGDLENFEKIAKEGVEATNKVKEAVEKTSISFTEGISTLANGFSQLASATGSKKIGGIANIFSNAGSIGSGLKDLKGLGGIGSIAGMFSKTGFSSGMMALGSVAGIAAAGIGIVTTIGSMISARGKKKKAKIEAENRANEEVYKNQVSAMEQLTEALRQNSERIKTFSDRMLTDVAKNPTLKAIQGGNWNFGLMHDSMISGKHFNDISALEKGRKKYRSGFRHKKKTTYTKVDIGEGALLKYLGFDKTELDAFTNEEMKQLDKVLNQVNHEALRRATGRNLSESNVEEWKKQVHEFVEQIKLLEKESGDLFHGATLESFDGIDYKSEKDLIRDYTEQFKQMGLVGEQYNQTIQEMAKNNQVLVTSMLDVRNNTIDSFASGNGSFLNSTKAYFEKIYKNASSVAYDVLFSDIDSYMTDMFKSISNKLVDIKKSGKLNFSGLFADFDFEKLKLAEINEKQARQSLDIIKQELLSSGVDLSLINKILPHSDFNDRINDLQSALSSAMNQGLQDHKFTSFTETLGQSLYDSTKNSLVKAFSESSLYQGLIQKFIKAEDFQGRLEKAGTFQEAFGVAENIMKQFGYEMEAVGFGGFDAINNLKKAEDTQLGNAYYSDKASNVEITFNNNYYGDIYGMDDFENVNRKLWNKCMDDYRSRPNASR